jgi:hypothetical protein
MDFAGIAKKIVNDQDGLFGALVVFNPTVANYIKEAGYDTVEKLTQFLSAPTEGQPAKVPPPMPAAKGPSAKGPSAKGPMMGFGGPQITIVVTGGSNNNYWSYGGMACRQSVSIDKWR